MIEEKCTIIRKIYDLHLKMTAATFVKHVGIGGAKIGKLKGTEKKLLIWLSGNRSST